VNGFHVQAVGWVLTVNAFTLSPPEAEELSGLWTDLVRIRAEDVRLAHPLFRCLFLRSLPLSPSARDALAMLVGRMVAQHPERFGPDALRQRRDHWARHVALGFLLTAFTAILLPQSWPFAETVASTFLLMACACLLPLLTLWRATAAVRQCIAHDRVRGHVPPSLSTRLRAR
jgi:hypothetical protein